MCAYLIGARMMLLSRLWCNFLATRSPVHSTATEVTRHSMMPRQHSTLKTSRYEEWLKPQSCIEQEKQSISHRHIFVLVFMSVKVMGWKWEIMLMITENGPNRNKTTKLRGSAQPFILSVQLEYSLYTADPNDISLYTDNKDIRHLAHFVTQVMEGYYESSAWLKAFTFWSIHQLLFFMHKVNKSRANQQVSNQFSNNTKDSTSVLLGPVMHINGNSPGVKQQTN